MSLKKNFLMHAFYMSPWHVMYHETWFSYHLTQYFLFACSQYRFFPICFLYSVLYPESKLLPYNNLKLCMVTHLVLQVTIVLYIELTKPLNLKSAKPSAVHHVDNMKLYFFQNVFTTE